MRRQAGLAQIPFQLGEPVGQAVPPQAGLAPPPSPPGGAGAAPAGGAQVVTMADREALARGMAARGMRADEIRAELTQLGLIQSNEPEVEQEVDPASLGDVVRQGTRGLVGMGIQGAGLVAERAFGQEGAIDRAHERAETFTAMTPEEEAAFAARREGQGLPGEIGDAAAGSIALTGAIIGGGVIGGALGGALGSLAGPAGTAAGAAKGASWGAAAGRWIGALAPAIPVMFGSALERARENGHDVNDPRVQSEAMATGIARSVLELFGVERLGMTLMRPAVDAAKRNLAKAAVRGGARTAAIEAAAETAGEVLEIAVFDPEVRAQLAEGELEGLGKFLNDKYGRELVVGAGASVLVGSGLGGPGATYQQNRVNAQRDQDVETLAAVAEEGGVPMERLQAAASDPAEVPALATAAREIGEARRDIQLAQTVLDGAVETGDQSMIAEAQDRYRGAVEKADATYDRVMSPFGALNSKQIEAKKEQAAQRARDILVEKDLATRDAVDAMDRQTVGSYAQSLAQAEDQVNAARERLGGSDMFETAKRAEAQADLRTAETTLQKTKDDIALKTGRTTPETLKQEAKQREDLAQYEAATERQYERKFSSLMKTDPEAARSEAEAVIKANEVDGDKGLNTAIRKLETKLDKATTVDEINKLEAEIADKRSRLGRQPPIVAAARRALENVGPRQRDAEVQGESPAAARQPLEPEATTATATPDAASTVPASTPEPAQGPQPEAAPEVSPQAIAPAAVPEGVATAPQVDPPTLEQSEAMDRLRAANRDKLVGDPEDAYTAAPNILQMGAAERARLGLAPDATPQETYMAGGPRELLGFERDLQSALNLPVDATPSQMRQALDEVDRLFVSPDDTAAAPPEAETEAATPTRQQARQAAEAEAATAAVQARLDREYQQSPAPQFAPETRTATGTENYTDMMDAFGRRSATLKQARDFVRENGARTGYEYVVAIDRQTGEVLGAGTNNHPNMVFPSDAAKTALQQGRDVDFVHNHPQNTTLSGPDLAFMYQFPGTARITAVAADGTAYTAEPTEAGRRVLGKDGLRMITRLTDITQDGRNHATKVYGDTLRAWADEGAIRLAPDGVPTEADRMASFKAVRRAINRAMAQEGLIKYTETGPRELITSLEQSAYERGIRNARKAVRDAYALPAGARSRPARARSGDVQRPGTVRSGRRQAAARESGDPGDAGSGLADPDGSVAGPDAGVSAVSAVERGRGGRSSVARAPREGETVAGLTPTQAYETTNGTTVYEVTAPQDFTQRAEAAKQTMGPIGAQVGTEPGTRQFLMHDGQSGFALDGDNIVSVFTTDGAPSGVMDAVLELGVDEGGRRLDAFDTFLPPAYARRGFRAVARLPFNREFAPEGWDYGYYQDVFGNSDPDVVFMVYDPANASADTTNTIADYGDGETAQRAAIDESGLAEAAELPPIDVARVRRGQGAGRQHPTWHDLSAQLPDTITPDDAAAEVLRRGQDGFEYAIVTRDGDGAVLGAGTNRARNAVASSDAAIDYYRNDIAPVTLTHNHPDPTPLSWSDMAMTLGSASDLTTTAVLPDGSRETARLTSAAREMDFRDRMDVLARAEQKIYTRMRGSGQQAAIARASALNRALAQSGAIDYTPGLPDPTDPSAREAIDAAAAELQDSYPSLRDARDTGRSQEPGGSPADGETAIGPEAVRSIRSASDRAIAHARSPDIKGRASPSQYPDPIVNGLAESADLSGLPAEAQTAMRDMADRLKANREAFKASRPDLHPLVLDSNGDPLVVFHGTQTPGFVAFNTEGGTQPAFNAFNPDTAVTYSGDFKRDLADKFARFRTENVDTADVLTSPEVAEAYGVDIAVGGSVVRASRISDFLHQNHGKEQADALYAKVQDKITDPVYMTSTHGISATEAAEVQALLGMTPEQWGDVTEPWYNAQYRPGSQVMRDGGPVVDIPYPTARDLLRRMMVDRAARKIRSDALSGSKGAHLGGSVYPLFVDMTNPLVVDYQGREWDAAPPAAISAGYSLPDPDSGPGMFRHNTMMFDFDTYGGQAQAQAAADQWVAAVQDQGAKDTYADPVPMFRTTDAWARHAHQQGYDGVIFQNIRDSGSRLAPVDDVFVVFRPEQLKHALDNEGTFRRDDPNMLAENQELPVMQEAADRRKAAEKRAKKILQPPAWMDVKTQQGSALKAAIDIARTPGVITKFASFVENQVVNRMAPLRNYEIRKTGQLGVGMDSMFKAAEVAVNDPGRNEALLYYGGAKLGANGEFQVAENTIGLHTMFKKLPDGQSVLDWMEYMGARRAQEIQAKGLETPLTDADIQAGLAKETPLFKEVAADWKRFNDANVDFLVDTGRISKALATTLKQDAAYVPFYRSDETVEGIHDLMDDAQIRKASISRRGGGVLNRDPGIKKLTGGKTRQVNNLIENMIRNSQAMIGAGMRNRAANLTFEMMEQAGDVSLQPARRKTADGDYVNVTMPKDAVRMWRKGGEYFAIPETADAIPVITALASLQPTRMGGIHKAMAAIGSFFRQSITLSPSFIVRNMIRDAISTGVLFQGKNLTPSNNMFKGFVSSLRHSASRQAYTAMSGMGDFRFGGTDIGLGKNDILIELGVMKPSLIGQMGYQFRRGVAKMEALGTASELSNRVATYDALVAENVRPDEAAYQALTITNYSRKGANDQLQMLLPLIPFLNARIQGVSRIWEDATTKRGKQRQQALMKLAISGGLLSAASALLWGWNNRDEESREEYLGEPLHRRLNYHIFYAGDRKFMIPKAFEVGTLFGTIPELAMEAGVKGNTDEIGQATVMTLVNTFSFNPIPQALLPALELTANYNTFTGRPIEGMRVANLMREDRINPQTSALATALARSGFGTFTGLSPIQTDHLLSGYGGVAYSSLAATIDAVGGELGLLPKRPTGVFGDIPVINSVLENTFRSMFRQRDADPATRWIEDFYDMRSAITQIHRSAREAALNGDIERARHLLTEAPATPEMHRLVNQAGARLSDLNGAIRLIQGDPDLSGEQKRQKLDRLIRARNKLALEVTKIIRDAEEQQGTSFRRVAR